MGEPGWASIARARTCFVNIHAGNLKLFERACSERPPPLAPCRLFSPFHPAHFSFHFIALPIPRVFSLALIAPSPLFPAWALPSPPAPFARTYPASLSFLFARRPLLAHHLSPSLLPPSPPFTRNASLLPSPFPFVLAIFLQHHHSPRGPNRLAPIAFGGFFAAFSRAPFPLSAFSRHTRLLPPLLPPPTSPWRFSFFFFVLSSPPCGSGPHVLSRNAPLLFRRPQAQQTGERSCARCKPDLRASVRAPAPCSPQPSMRHDEERQRMRDMRGEGGRGGGGDAREKQRKRVALAYGRAPTSTQSREAQTAHAIHPWEQMEPFQGVVRCGHREVRTVGASGKGRRTKRASRRIKTKKQTKKKTGRSCIRKCA